MNKLTKICTTCKIRKPLEQFLSRKNTKDGYRNQCISCFKYRSQTYRDTPQIKNKRKNYDRIYSSKNLHKIVKRHKHYRLLLKQYSPGKLLCHNAKQRANKKHIPFNITEDYINSIIPKRCPALGIQIYMNKGKAYNNSMTLDRIDNSKGYTIGNVQVISKLANSMKRDSTREQLINFAKCA